MKTTNKTYGVLIQFHRNGVNEGIEIPARDPKTLEDLRFGFELDAKAEVNRQLAWRPDAGDLRRSARVVEVIS